MVHKTTTQNVTKVDGVGESPIPLTSSKSMTMLECSSRNDEIGPLTMTKSVSFSNVRVREHSIIIGDHPACEVLPLSLGWGYAPETVCEIDAYEVQRSNDRSCHHVSISRHSLERQADSQCCHSPRTPAISISAGEAVDSERETRSAKRLSYNERKALLKRISGLGEHDLMRLERHRRLRSNVKGLKRQQQRLVF